jgi:hypothetical protein
MNTDDTTVLPLNNVDAESANPVSLDGSGEDDLVTGSGREAAAERRGSGSAIASLVVALLVLGSGLSIGYLLWGEALHASGVIPVVQAKTLDATPAHDTTDLAPVSGPVVRPTQGPALPPAQYIVKLPESYTLPVRYGSLGPQLVKGGAIDLPAFTALYADSRNPLSSEQQAILSRGSDAPVVIDHANAHFLLNFFWAVGLANRNAILLEGPIQENGAGQVEYYASTGGWTLASKPVMEIFASLPLIKLSAEQQGRLETVVEAVYRPCCGNSTAFPDCNHGMAMLGLLELMAANDASEDEMFEAAKYVNAFWFPNETIEAAAYFKLTQNQDFGAIDPRLIVGPSVFSSSGAQSIKQWLSSAGRLGKPVRAGGDCGV